LDFALLPLSQGLLSMLVPVVEQLRLALAGLGSD
jgi:hypothetical protein